MKDINQEDEIIVEAEEWEPMKFYAVGGYFTINGELYKTLNTDYESCLGCDFSRKEYCGRTSCFHGNRADNNDVIFTLYDTLAEE